MTQPHEQRDEVLEQMLDLEVERGVIRTGPLVERFGSADTEQVVADLVADGAVERSGDELTLTPSGRELATTIVRRHRLAERLLRDVIGLEWWKVHREAASWEQVISDDVEARLMELLGDPGTCPHGNPIPGSVNLPDQSDAVLLKDAPEGPISVVRIEEELEEDDDALLLMERIGFIPGRNAEIAGSDDEGVKVIGSVADGVLPPHVARMTWVRTA